MKNFLSEPRKFLTQAAIRLSRGCGSTNPSPSLLKDSLSPFPYSLFLSLSLSFETPAARLALELFGHPPGLTASVSECYNKSGNWLNADLSGPRLFQPG